MVVNKTQIVSLYRNMMREARKFPAYNFRTYALRKIRASFQENKSLSDSAEIQKKYDYAIKNLGILKRQVVITSLYRVENIVVENTLEEKARAAK